MKKLMKQLGAVTLCATMVLSTNLSVAYADTNNGIDLYLNGEKCDLEDEPFIKNGRTMVPLRFISESLGIKTSYNSADRSAKMSIDDLYAIVYLDSTTANFNGDKVTLNTAPVFKDGRMYVGLADVGSLFGLESKWDADERAVYLEETDPSVDVEETVTEPAMTDEEVMAELVEIFESKTFTNFMDKVMASENLKAFGEEIMKSPYFEGAIDDVLNSDSYLELVDAMYGTPEYQAYVKEIEALPEYQAFIKAAGVPSLFTQPGEMGIEAYIDYTKKIMETPGYLQLSFKFAELDSYQAYMNAVLNNEDLVELMDTYITELSESENIMALAEVIANSKNLEKLVNEIVEMPEFYELIELIENSDFYNYY